MFGFSKQEEDYRKYRWFFTSSGTLVVGGKSDEQNEIVFNHFLKKGYYVMHTSSPGSPFMIIQSDNPTSEDKEETAIFCACFSKQWKRLKNEKEKVAVDIFRAEQLYKNRLMKKGSFGVNGEKKTIVVTPALILIFQKGKLRTIAKTKQTVKKGGEVLAEIKLGSLTKEQACEKIARRLKETYQFPVSKDEIMAALPSDKMSVK
ncbi:MAG: NFACT RNA binding domain-containing protein [Nanoarchaeota archaeon]